MAVLSSQRNERQQSHAAGESSFDFGTFSGLTVIAFDGVRGINELSYFSRVFKIAAWLFPIPMS